MRRLRSRGNSVREFKSPFGVPSGGEVGRCFYPFKLDTYGGGRGNDCLYCYAKASLEFRKLWNPENPSVADPKKIDEVFRRAVDFGKGKFADVINARVPVRLGSMTDCFCDAEKKHRVTLEVLKILSKYDYPYLIFTKNKLVAEYIPYLRKDLAYIQITMTTPFEDVARILEPKASSVEERLLAVKKLSEEGFYTGVRINPLFPSYSGTDKYRVFDFSLIEKVGEAGARTLIAGFLRLSSRNIKSMRSELGGNWKSLFGCVKARNQSYHFSYSAKKYHYEKIKEICDRFGMEFSVCFDTDSSYETFKYLWKNQEDCCNGKGKLVSWNKTFEDFRAKQ